MKYFFLVFFLWVTAAFSRELPPPRGPAVSSAPLEVDFDGIAVSDLVVAVYRDVERVPFSVSPDVFNDRRSVSLHVVGQRADFDREISAFFGRLGYDVRRSGGVVSVVVHVEPEVKPAPEPERFNYIYRPQYRAVSYLVDQMRPLVASARFGSDRGQRSLTGSVSRSGSSAGFSYPGVNGSALQSGQSVQAAQVSAQSQQLIQSASPSSSLGQLDRDVDVLVVNGVAEDIALVKSLLPQLDVPEGDLVIRATVFEVSTEKQDGSALALAGSVLKGKLGVAFGPATALADSFTVKTGSLSAVVSALGSDSHFRSLSSPVARARSGSTAHFVSGQDVPTVSSVSYTGSSSTPVQSVTYRSAGVIFDVKPVLREKAVSLDVDQELSNFVATNTGVNNSPTLIKRSMTSSLTVDVGDIVFLGGLVENKATKTTDRLSFLPDWLGSDTDDKSRLEVILVLQVLRAGDGDVGSRSSGHLVGGSE